MKYLQKLGKALMLPVSCMPICGLLMGLGYFLCPYAMQGGEISGVVESIGYFLIRAGGALIDHIAWLFAIGVGIGMSEDNDGTGALAALVSWLVITTLLGTDTIRTFFPSLSEGSSKLLAFAKIDNPFIGILSGIIGSGCYNRFHKTRLPDWLSFFSGKRAVAIVAGLLSIAVSLILLFLWPLVFGSLTALGHGIQKLGPAGAGIYAFLNRLLIPFGLHHALNNVFWLDTIGLGDLTHFWAGETSKDVTWSLGMYMSGFFPCMMFGVPAAALAMFRRTEENRRKAAEGILLSSAVCAFICGVTEPFEFSFMFLAPVLYVVYAALYGIMTFVTVLSGFRAGFCFSAGIMDLVFSASLPAAAKTWLILPLGAAAFALFYAVFSFMIRKWHLKTPGSEEEVVSAQPDAAGDSDSKYTDMARTILRGLGGAENLLQVDNCVTRLRLEVRDMGLVNYDTIRSSGAMGVMHTGKNSLQIVIGTDVQFVADELKRLWEGSQRDFAGMEKTFAGLEKAFAGSENAVAVPADRRMQDEAKPDCEKPGAVHEQRDHRMVTRHDLIFGDNVCNADNGMSRIEVVGSTADASDSTVEASGSTPEAFGSTAESFDSAAEDSGSMAEEYCFEYVIRNKTGIHARPAGEIAAIAKRYDCEITVEANGKTSSAGSVIGMMALGAAEGTHLRCKASRPEGAQALEAIRRYVEVNL